MVPRIFTAVRSLVAAFALAACASSGKDPFLDSEQPWKLESVSGGRRLRVDGLFEVTAPVVIRADGGLLFESTSTRRDVVFTELADGRPPGLRLKERRVEFRETDWTADVADEQRRFASSHPAPPPGAEPPAPRTVHANHVRIRKDGPDRYLVAVIDQDCGEPQLSALVSSIHFDFEVTR